MKAFKGYEPKVNTGNFDRLPVGNYIVKILAAKEQAYTWGSVLLIQFDIAEGEYAGYYTDRYNNRQNKEEKYKGVFRLNVPKADGSEKDKWTMAKFNHCMGCLEADNPNFTWKWDESKLKGLKAGMVFREKEWAYDGKTGTYPEPFNLARIDDIEKGLVRTPKPKLLSEEEKQAAGLPNIDVDEFTEINSDAGDLPF